MATRVLLTIDTEISWRQHQAGRGWRDAFARAIDPAGVGIGYQLGQLARYGLKACFFVDPLPALVYGIEPIRRTVAMIRAAGQEVQLHVHPCWAGAVAGDKGEAYGPFELTRLDGDRQRELIEQAYRLLLEAGAPPPVAFRAGSFGADDRTLAALPALGIRFDSSFNGSQHPSPCAIDLPVRQMAPVRHGGVFEVPVSLVEEPSGALRHLQICALSAAEMRAGLNHADRCDHPLAVVVSHSFELANQAGDRPNRVVKARFDALCCHLATHRASQPTVAFFDLDEHILGGAAEPMRTGAWRRAARMVGQAASTIEHGRVMRAPVPGAALAGVPATA